MNLPDFMFITYAPKPHTPTAEVYAIGAVMTVINLALSAIYLCVLTYGITKGVKLALN